MSASFYDIMKYAKTGIASPDMTYYDRLKASALFGGTSDETITGIPPLTLTARKAGAATSYKLTGKTVQNGIPTPDAPIDIQGVGERTANLLDLENTVVGYINNNGVDVFKGDWLSSDFIEIIPNITYTFNPNSQLGTGAFHCFYDADKSHILSFQSGERTMPAPQNAKYLRVCWRIGDSSNIMLNSGSTALPYEPYGYKIPITSNGATAATVYIGQTQTVRRVKKLVLDGTENWCTAVSDTGLFGIQRFEPMQVQPFIPGYSAISNCYVYNPVQSGVDAATVSGEFVLQAFRAGIAWQYNFFIKDGRYNSLNSFKSYLAQQYANGTPVTVWYVLAEPTTGIVNEPLMKIGDYADELRSSEQTPPLMLSKGVNVIDVDTTPKPSEMSITGQIKAI